MPDMSLPPALAAREMTQERAVEVLRVLALNCGRCSVCRRVDDLERHIPDIRAALEVAVKRLEARP